MRQICAAFLLAIAAFPLFSAEQSLFHRIREAVCPEGKDQELRSVSIVYEFSDEEMQGTKIIVHAKAPGKLRMDTVSGKNFSTACLDGSFSWKCSSQSGVSALSPEELMEFKQDMVIFPVKIKAEQLFNEPERVCEEMRGKTLCTRYAVTPKKNPALKIDFWLDNQTMLPKRIEAKDGDGSYKTMFRDYRDCSGIMVASRIHLASNGEFYTLRLRSVEWNKAVPDDFFSKPANAANCLKDVANLVGKKVLPDLKKDTVTRKDIRTDELEKKIRELTTRIKMSEAALQKMEDAMATNQKDAVALASVSSYGGSYRSVWNRHGFVSYRTGGTRDSTTRRKAIKQMGKANAEMAKQYENIAEELLKMQVELGDTKAALAKLNPNSPYAK